MGYVSLSAKFAVPIKALFKVLLWVLFWVLFRAPVVLVGGVWLRALFIAVARLLRTGWYSGCCCQCCYRPAGPGCCAIRYAKFMASVADRVPVSVLFWVLFMYYFGWCSGASFSVVQRRCSRRFVVEPNLSSGVYAGIISSLVNFFLLRCVHI